MTESPLTAMYTELGARMGEVAGRVVPRNYGDPAAEYEAVRSGAGLLERADRVLLRAHGRDPVKMVQGLVSNDLAGAAPGQGVYAAVLTPKGRMIAEVRIFRREAGDLLLDVDAAALSALLDHLRKYVPPLFARFAEQGTALSILGVYGPRARELVAETFALALPEDAAEDAFVTGSWEGHALLAAKTLYAGEEGWELVLPRDALVAAWEALRAAGARPIGHATLDVLRIEAGRPRWGAELDETTIPLEAGLRDRAISQTKGCYTGQEVIIRILHRGHVNWLLRGVALGGAPAPAPGSTLVRPGETKAVGRMTSACFSPLHAETIGLAYVRREIEPPATLRLQGAEGAEGAEAQVFELPIPVRP